MKNNIPEALAIAEANHIAAAEALTMEAKRAYPVGARVNVFINNTFIVGVVTGHSGCWWYEPARVKITNERTGKRRHFSATSECARAVVLSLPEPETAA